MSPGSLDLRCEMIGCSPSQLRPKQHTWTHAARKEARVRKCLRRRKASAAQHGSLMEASGMWGRSATPLHPETQTPPRTISPEALSCHISAQAPPWHGTSLVGNSSPPATARARTTSIGGLPRQGTPAVRTEAAATTGHPATLRKAIALRPVTVARCEFPRGRQGARVCVSAI